DVPAAADTTAAGALEGAALEAAAPDGEGPAAAEGEGPTAAAAPVPGPAPMPVATARAVDAAGDPLPELGLVSTAAPPAEAPLVLDALVSDEVVPLGDSVDFGLTVANPAGG